MCSTPYGDNAIWTGRVGRLLLFVYCAQRLTATMRFGPGRDLPMPAHRAQVLNALRRQCDLDHSLRAAAPRESQSAQRLTATMRFGRATRPHSPTAKDGCSTPYGDNAIWTRYVLQPLANPKVLNALRRQCDLDRLTARVQEGDGGVLNALRRQCDLDS